METKENPFILSIADRYLFFINSLNFIKFSTEIISVLEVRNHESEAIVGWEGITSFTCLSHNKDLYDIDVRYAWGQEIFKQNLFDHGWNEDTLMHWKRRNQPVRHKLIIYLCEASTGLHSSPRFDSVPNQFLIGTYWKSISHLYLSLPIAHPFLLPNISQQRASLSYATTRNLRREKPILSKNIETLLFLPTHPQRLGEGGLRTKGWFKSPTENKPLVSVITVVFNGEKYIEQTIQSVINQSYDHLEYIIIDGGSTDETVNIIRKYEEQINYWVSEPDSGIYDAMNKGTLLACGSHTLHTNADDLLFQPNSLELNLNFQNVNYLRSVLIYQVIDRQIIKSPPKLIHKNIYNNIIDVPVHHPGFIGIKNQKSIFNSSYKIIADSIVIANKIKSERIDVSSNILAIYRTGGLSNENNFQILKEDWKMIEGSKNVGAYITIIKKEVRCRLRELVKAWGLLKIKRRYFN